MKNWLLPNQGQTVWRTVLPPRLSSGSVENLGHLLARHRFLSCSVRGRKRRRAPEVSSRKAEARVNAATPPSIRTIRPHGSDTRGSGSFHPGLGLPAGDFRGAAPLPASHRAGEKPVTSKEMSKVLDRAGG